MQRGIDSFFKKIAPANKAESDRSPPVRVKRKARVIISSDEDEVPESPQVEKVSNTHQSKKSRSNVTSPGDKARKETPPKPQLKPVDPTSMFGGKMVRVEAKKPPKPKEATVIELEDEEIDHSLMEVDVDDSVMSSQKGKKTSPNKKAKTPKKGKDGDSEIAEKKITPPSSKKHKLEDVWKEEEKTGAKNHTPKVKKEKKEDTTHAKKEHVDLETSVLSDEERHERKRASAMLYQKYKNRQSVINPGSKEVPKGKPNCLAGLTFLVTGVLESLERDETASIIKEYGGKMMTVVGKRLNYLIVGEEAGPKKLVQAEEFNIPILSEDGFFDLIRSKSGLDTKKAEKKQSEDVKEEKPTVSPKIKMERSVGEIAEKRKTEKVSPKKHNIDHTKGLIKQEKVSPVKSELRDEVHTSKKEVDEGLLALVDKYKPTCVKDIIGQQGAASNAVKLTNWLSKWYINHDGKKKLQKPNPWAKNDDGSYYKAALLSGPPGIGKTTTATLVCKELGFDTVEFNASDTRSKRLLKEEVSELLSNKSLFGFCHGSRQAVTKKHVLLMDEVDGMAGNEDRGGIQELIGLIKDSSVPIICMCNDRNHQKMRSLVNYCYDLRFPKPRLEQIKGRILSICCKEKFKLDQAKIEEIITATNNDIRQSINHIALLSAGKELNLKSDAANSADKIAQKDLKIGPWEVVRKVFSAEEHKHMTIHDKSDLFFNDYSLAPLFVQQNYLQVSPAGPKSEVMRKVASTADSLSLGDLVDKRIRSNSAWVLLPTLAMFSSVMPGEFMAGHFTGQINFPGWLGKYSRSNKRSRLAQEIHDHTRLRTSGSRLSIRLDYAPYLLANIVRPLKEKGMDGVEDSLAVIKEYHLLREDLDSLIELTTWPGKKGSMDAVDGRVKAALTRSYNKEIMPYSYSIAANIKKKKSDAIDADAELLNDEGEEGVVMTVSSDEEKEDDAVENDGLIKAKKKSNTASKPSTSKATGKKNVASKSKAAPKSKK